MGKKLIFNVLLNLGIFLCLLLTYSGFQSGRYEYVLGSVFIGAVLVIIKIRLIKEVRNTQR
ncbi:hypothetical protein FPZ43_07865 [Mucilaginibacter pallidiroseus]|uniref:Uncharacterized protein n=1 Tax=Mucilaginibacter pallidiroseus TaxID=2599295 RepID=A0A563UEH0_9SPHI|nr:DUF6358 family protein [Mucilaginibacter pallidiroseus]TWR29765.1 hypothetical protein FPZ43_07865 [Mucilaginibacter pallidiroseus]